MPRSNGSRSSNLATLDPPIKLDLQDWQVEKRLVRFDREVRDMTTSDADREQIGRTVRWVLAQHPNWVAVLDGAPRPAWYREILRPIKTKTAILRTALHGPRRLPIERRSRELYDYICKKAMELTQRWHMSGAGHQELEEIVSTIQDLVSLSALGPLPSTRRQKALSKLGILNECVDEIIKALKAEESRGNRSGQAMRRTVFLLTIIFCFFDDKRNPERSTLAREDINQAMSFVRVALGLVGKRTDKELLLQEVTAACKISPVAIQLSFASLLEMTHTSAHTS